VLKFQVEGSFVLKRAIGCSLLVHVPDQGLDEALEYLKGLLEFYRPAPVNSFVTVRTKEHALSGVQKSERPPLLLPEAG
jgi:hypothetical protein